MTHVLPRDTTHDGESGGDGHEDGLAFLRGDGVRPRVMDAFRKHLGSPLVGVFGGVLFDEVALMPVAASVDRTGRFRQNFTDRGIRSALSAISLLAGNQQQRAATAQWLKERHRDVRGTGVGEYEGIRYSALDPELWIWIAASAMNATMEAFPYCTGYAMTPAEKEAGYQYQRYLLKDLELPSAKGKFPDTYAAFVDYYDDMVENRLQSNGFLREQFAGLMRLPLPTLLLPAAIRPALLPVWLAIRPMAGRVIQVCSAKAMHPQIREMIGFRLKPRHNVEFAVYTRLLQLVWRVTPERLLIEPMLYNTIRLDDARSQLDGSRNAQRRYDKVSRSLTRRNERLADFYHSYRLDSFAVPEQPTGTCPFG
ncbi:MULTISPECIES: oxygenase MpaB family protein [unclassified Mycobacterium]|uniref:oxygenase MpaB family protein n=1 Tax=unclassified Mycobacterium TaxID=2642494 RepID=UPI0009932F03|nr:MULTISPECIES: oxygenase MpaB family protein [unclassified Mycobacterium]